MSTTQRIPSLVKKYLMALSGLVLALFVLGHMLGNIQFLLGSAEPINAYAHHLHNMPGKPFTLWAIRGVLLICLVVHVWMAVLLTKENRQARPDNYNVKKSEVATYAARTMPVTGVLILGFIIFHILQYTTRIAPENYNETIQTATIMLDGAPVQTFDVFAMMVKGFSSVWISLFYVFIMALLCMHLTHGFASMFQSVGLRNEAWRYKLVAFAKVYGWVVFLGFAAIPVAVLGGYGKSYLAEKQAQWAAQSENAAPMQTLSISESVSVQSSPVKTGGK